MNRCKWLSVYQLIQYHSLILFWKKIYTEKCSFLSNGLVRCNDGTFCEIKGRILLTNDSWKMRTIRLWNSLSIELRFEDNMASFKKKLRVWVLENVKLKI